MRVLMLSGDQPGRITGCGMYRLMLPAQQMRAAGWEVKVDYKVDAYTKTDPRTGLITATRLPAPPEYDLVVFQRPANHTIRTIIPLMAEHTAVVVELDDDLERTAADNAAYPGIHPGMSPASNWLWLKEACREADMVTVSTPSLLRYARAGHGHVLPNYIPESVTGYHRAFEWSDNRPRIGWSGQVATHPHDLQTTRGGIAQALADTGAGIHIVGQSEGAADALGLTDGTPLTETGWLPINEYPDALTAIDVGIVPLEDTAFNHAKSYLKGLEFAALGIPFVASPTPEYRRLHDEFGIGLLANRPRDWRRLVGRLVADEGYRRELGASWREKVTGNLTCETNGWRWMRAYEQAVRMGAARRGVLTTAGR